MSVPDTVRHQSRQVILETYDEVGYNYPNDRYSGGNWLQKLRRLDEIVERRRVLAQRYRELPKTI